MQAADIDRRIENLLMLGTIASVDRAAARCTVKAGRLLTAPLPWITQRAGDARAWWAPSVGEQVLLLSPGGDPKRAVVLPGVYCTAFPAPSTADQVHSITYPDGAVVAYDAAQHALTATLPNGGTADIAASGGVHVTGDVTVTGKLHVTDQVQLDSDVQCDATLTAATDVQGGGISLKTHVHAGVTSGGAISGPPQ